MGSYSAPFYIGHHDSQRKEAVTEELYHHAQDLGYDTLTTKITNESYQPRVLFQLSEYMRKCESASISGATSHLAPLTLAALTADDTDLFPSDLAPRLLHLASPWIDIASPDPVISDISRQVLELEVSYAAFCGVTNLLIYGPHPGASEGGLAKFARAVKKALELGPGIQFQISLPMSYAPQSQKEPSFADLSRFIRDEHRTDVTSTNPNHDMLSSWDVWHHIRSLCKYDNRLCVALTIPRHLPPIDAQNRWKSEPIRILHFPKSSFTPNKLGVDVLAKPHQVLLNRYLRLKTAPWFLLSDIGPLPDDDTVQMGTNNLEHGGGTTPSATNPTPAEASRQPPAIHPSQKPLAHLEYFRSHLQTRQPPLTPLEQYGAGYQDFPQSPLQPLTDNLESVTYEVFEKDPIKYEWYERAVMAALNDWRRLKKPCSWNNKVVIAVVGAGRGPLVARSLIAAEKARVDVDIWAVEKNPSAFVHLHRRKREEWGDRVHLFRGDMRDWTGPLYPAGNPAKQPTQSSLSSSARSEHPQPAFVDILVSELLGSFADNELSPECLDGAQRFLQPIHGVSIPTSYTAHLTPIAAPRLWTDIASRGKMVSGTESTSIPYVAWLHAIDYLSTQPGALPSAGPTDGLQFQSSPPPSTGRPQTLESQPVPIVKETWSFSHPIPESSIMASNSHNVRFAHLTFPAPHRGICHGLGGYFESVLYESKATGQSLPGAPEHGTQDDGMAWSATTKPLHGLVELSTHPNTMADKSADMISWFPIFFPLKEPLYIPDNAEIAVSMWRQTDGRKVWYEWLVDVSIVLGGKMVKTGSSGLISSEREGCLM